MPRKSCRLEAILGAKTLLRQTTAALLLFDPEPFVLESSDPTTLSFLAAVTRLIQLRNSRYFLKRQCRKSTTQQFEEDLLVNEDGSQWLNDSEFKMKYRMSRETLDKVTAAIENNEVFAAGTRGPKQLPVKHQLMVLLQFLGKEGETNESQRQTFKTSYGANSAYRDRVVQALIALRKEYIRWPNEDERKEISDRIECKFHFPNCIGFMDGTLFPLALEPSSDDAADYHGRKYPYSLTVLVINDDKRRIRAYLAGYPGSTHDNRLWRNMKQNKYSELFFSTSEYVL